MYTQERNHHIISSRKYVQPGKFTEENILTMKPPVSVCHQVSEIGHLESPTTLKNHLKETGGY